MTVFSTEPIVDLYNEGFEDDDADVLQRAKFGRSLSALVERINEPVVIALDGRWGTGKSYFLQRWVGAHAIQHAGKAKTVYFDAFANDYISDPLPALVSTVLDRLKGSETNAKKRVKKAVFHLAKPAARIAVSVASAGLTEVAGATVDALISVANKEVTSALDSYWRAEEGRRAAMEQFRAALLQLISEQSSDQNSDVEAKSANLVIVVDELDRCRPDYALEVLEVIKHFFAIPGVIFVLGANLSSLENSVKARYGAEIDASAYLRKFIFTEISLPQKTMELGDDNYAVLSYLRKMCRISGFDHAFIGNLGQHLKIVMKNNDVSLRDINKIVANFSLCRDESLLNGSLVHGWRSISIAFGFMKVINPVLLKEIVSNEVSAASLKNYFYDERIDLEDASFGAKSENPPDQVTLHYFTSCLFVANGNDKINDQELLRSVGRSFDQAGYFGGPSGIAESVYENIISPLGENT